MRPAARWLVRGLLLFLLTFANVNDIWSPDVVPNTLLAWTIVREGDVDLDEFTVPGPAEAGPSFEAIPRQTYYFRACGASTFSGTPDVPRSAGGPPPPGPRDRVCSIFPPGVGLLALPVLVPFVLAGADPSDGALVVRAGHLAAALIEVVAALLLWSVLRRFAGARWALALVLLFWLATSVRTVASQALWQHSGVHLALAAALWLALDERVTVRRELLAGVALGLGTVVRQTTALIAIGVARLPWPRVAAVRLAAPVLFALGWTIGLLPLLAYDQVAFGSAFEQGYGDKPFGGDLATGLYGLLLSPSRGLLVYEPWIVAALAALALAWRRTGLVALRLRGISIAWLVLLVTYARYPEWWGGRVFGPRFLDDLAPALVAALAWGISQGLLARAWSRVAFAVAAGWSLLIFNAAALVYDPLRWDTVPLNVNFYPQRLFDWSDPQWLSVLSSLLQPSPRVIAAALLSAAALALLVRLEWTSFRSEASRVSRSLTAR